MVGFRGGWYGVIGFMGGYLSDRCGFYKMDEDYVNVNGNDLLDCVGWK